MISRLHAGLLEERGLCLRERPFVLPSCGCPSGLLALIPLSFPPGKQRGRCPKPPKAMCDLTSAVIKISSDSSSDSEAGLESDFNSSPESLFENDDVILIERTPNGFAYEDPGEGCLAISPGGTLI